MSLAHLLCPLTPSMTDTFTSRVLQVLLKDVKFGETVSYKRLAEMAGNPRAVRAVGGAMRKNPVSELMIDSLLSHSTLSDVESNCFHYVVMSADSESAQRL